MSSAWSAASYDEKISVLFDTVETYGPLVAAEVWTEDQALVVMRRRSSIMQLDITDEGLRHMIRNWGRVRADYRKEEQRLEPPTPPSPTGRLVSGCLEFLRRKA